MQRQVDVLTSDTRSKLPQPNVDGRQVRVNVGVPRFPGHRVKCFESACGSLAREVLRPFAVYRSLKSGLLALIMYRAWHTRMVTIQQSEHVAIDPIDRGIGKKGGPYWLRSPVRLICLGQYVVINGLGKWRSGS